MLTTMIVLLADSNSQQYCNDYLVKEMLCDISHQPDYYILLYTELLRLCQVSEEVIGRSLVHYPH